MADKTFTFGTSDVPVDVDIKGGLNTKGEIIAGDHIILPSGTSLQSIDSDGNTQALIMGGSTYLNLGVENYTDLKLRIKGTDWNDLFIKKDLYKDNISVNASSYTDGTISASASAASLTDYTPIGIVGTRLYNASTSGSNGAYASVSWAYLNDTTINFRIANLRSSACKVQFHARVLYIKNL